MNYLASPPLVVAYALAGTMDIDLSTDPIGVGSDGQDVYLADLWPSEHEVAEAIRASLTSEEFRRRYASVFDGDDLWQAVSVAEGQTFAWDGDSTYVLRPPFFDDMSKEPAAVADIAGARVLAVLGDSVTTDHISPAGSIKPTSPAGDYLRAHGVERDEFNSYGARRGNHEVMVRGTFANVRLRNRLAPGTEGGVTLHMPDGEQTTIFEASERYQAEGVPLLVLAGKEYGSGSSRDWAAKGTMLLGVRAVVAENYERIHRSNLVGMGVLPLQYAAGRDGGHPRADRPRGLLDHRAHLDERRGPPQGGGRAGRARRRHGGRVQRPGADRHPDGGRVLPLRGHPAVRALPAGRLRDCRRASPRRSRHLTNRSPACGAPDRRRMWPDRLAQPPERILPCAPPPACRWPQPPCWPACRRRCCRGVGSPAPSAVPARPR